MKKRMVWMLAGLGILFGVIFGFQIFKSIMIKQWILGNGTPPVTVSTMQAAFQPWAQQLTATGTLRAVQGVDVTTEVAGLVRNIEFTPGSNVEKGALLVSLNGDSEIAHLNSLIAAVDLAKATYERDKELFKAHAVSKQTIDTDDANLKSTVAQVEEQKAIIAKRSIVAPFSGRLGLSYVNPGQYLNAGDKIVTLQFLDPIYVDFTLPQQDIVKVQKGQAVQITINAYPGKVFTGKITAINPKVDATTRNVLVEATLANPNQELLPGMFSNVTVTTGEPINFLTLPQTAISFNPYGNIVYLVKDEPKDEDGKVKKTAHMIFVSTGETRGDQIAITKGLKEGETVVVAGQLKLKNGSVVAINNTLMPQDNPSPQPVDE